MGEPDWSVEGWKVQEMLGTSGMATLFRAVNQQGVVGALKVCFPSEGAMAAERMLLELNALSDLRGKRVSNVAELLDSGRTRDSAGYFVVTAFVDGPSLQAVLGQDVTLSLPATLAMIRGLGGRSRGASSDGHPPSRDQAAEHHDPERRLDSPTRRSSTSLLPGV